MLVDHLLKTKKIQNFKETGDRKYIYRNDLDKAFFQHDMAYGDFKDLARRTQSDKVLRNNAFNIAKNTKYGECQRGFDSVVYKFFDKKSAVSGIKNQITQNWQLAEEVHKPVIKTFKKEKFIHHLKTIFGVLILQICN